MEFTYILYMGEAIALTVMLGVIAIPLARKYKAQQSIREEGPKSHRLKAGTPTMGGLFVCLSVVLVVIWNRLADPSVLWLLFLTLGHGLLGFLDDLIKAEKKRNLGLTAKQKIAGQLILAAFFCWGCVETLHLPYSISIPFSSMEIEIGALYYIFAVLVVVGASNAVNLTDGLDGLASGCSVVTFLAYSVYCYVNGIHDIGLFSAILAGGCVGFLFFNYHPAEIFMGDTGSLALGGAVAGIAIVTKTELLLIFLGMVFVLEALSVILQVVSFQLTGKRIFKMSPLHHHFELSGWSEVRVVWSFWIFACVMACVTLMISFKV